MVWGMLSGSSPTVLAGPECPIPSVSVGILRAHLGRQLLERLATECGVLRQVDRGDAVSRLRQGGDDAGGQGVGIATRRFNDRIGDDPLDGRDIDPRHSVLLIRRTRAAALKSTIEADRYPPTPRIQTLRAILDKIRPEPVREPPPLKRYEPPRIGAATADVAAGPAAGSV